MSITINFYKSTSEPRKAEKSLTLLKSAACELKGDVDLTSPVILVKGDAAEFAACNYMTIDAFDRAYFVDRITCVPGGILQISASCDVLGSAWKYIKHKDAVIERQENAFNLLLNDGSFQAYANDQVITKDFPQGFDTPAYVLIVAG